MRQKISTPITPANAYRSAKNTHSPIMSNSSLIKIISNYCKERPIDRGMIKIESETDIRWYTIYDEIWFNKLNGTVVIVRRYEKEPGMIYLFDKVTDTYLTSVPEFIPVAGHLANSSEKSKKSIGIHVAKLKKIESYQEKKLEEILELVKVANVPIIPSFSQNTKIDQIEITDSLKDALAIRVDN